MQQAYLFDHIQPEMPAFNTNMFKLAQQSYLEQHVYQATETADKFNNEQNFRYDMAYKSYGKLRKNLINNMSYSKMLGQIAREETKTRDEMREVRSNKLDYIMLSNQIDNLCEQVDGLGFDQTEVTIEQD